MDTQRTKHITLIALAIVSAVTLAGCDSSGANSTPPVSIGGGTVTTPPATSPGSGTGTGSGSGSVPGTGSATSNSLPVAIADTAVVQAGSSANPLNVLANDRDADGDALAITGATLVQSVPASSGGTAVVAADGRTVRYSPPSGYVGVQTVRYTISDSRGGTSTAIALVTVSPLPVPPAALPDVFTVVTGSAPTTLAVLDNDVDGAGGGLVVASAQMVASVPTSSTSSVSVVAGSLRYAPQAGFTGVDTLSYTLRDANGATASATVVVTVLPLAAPPVALPDVVTFAAGSSGSIDVLANDVNLAGGALTLTSVTPLTSLPLGQAGTFAIANGQVSYTPPSATFAGTQTANYQVTDRNGATATGLITVLVTPGLPALPPVAVPDVATLANGTSQATLSVRDNDVDPAGGGLVITAASVVLGLPSSTGVSVSQDGAALSLSLPAGYSGVLTLSYTVRDRNNATATAAVLVTVTPAAVPAVPPVAVPDVATVAQDSAASTLDVRANDVDASGSGLTVTAASVTASLPAATHTVSAVAGGVRFTPAAGFAGVVSVSYTVTDGGGRTATSLVTITVTPAALAVPPVALPDVLTVTQGSSATVANVLANDIALAGGLTLVSATVDVSLPAATHALSTSAAGVSFTPAAGFAGVVIVRYTATDAASQSATGVLAVTVTPTLPVALPLALPDVITVAQGSIANLVTVLANDINPNAGALTLQSAELLTSLPAATHGLAVSGNQLAFTPASGFAGVVTARYGAVDALGNALTGLVAITVIPPLPVALPAAIGDVGSLLAGLTNVFNVLGNDIDPAGGGLTLQSVAFTNPLLAPLGSVLAIVGNQVQLGLPLLGVLAGVLPVQYTAVDSLGRTVTGVLQVTLLPL